MRSNLSSAVRKDGPTKYPLCSCPNHHNQPLNIVCVDPVCNHRGLICSLCKTSKHNKHETLPFKMLLKSFDEYAETLQAASVDKLMQELNLVQMDVLGTLRETVQKLALAVRDFEVELVKSFQDVVEEMVLSSEINQRIMKIVEQVKSNCNDDLSGSIRKLLEMVKFNQVKKKVEVENLGSLLLKEYKIRAQNYLDIVSQFETSSISLLANAKKETKEIKCVGYQYRFSESMKPPVIKLSENNAVARQTQSNNGDLRFAVVEPGLPLDKLSEITFNIKNRANWIGIGVCSRQIVKDKKFKFTYSTIGHGSFLLSTNGYTWSHSKAEDNIKLKAFEFDTGTNVGVTFDPHNLKLIYTNLTTHETYEQLLDLTEAEKTGGINFCANLCSCADEVRIVTNKVV